MAIDIVIDANVFAHAENPNNAYFSSAVDLVTNLVGSDESLALDDTGKRSPNEATSNLYREYTECLSPNSISFVVIKMLLDSGRVTFHRRPSREIWNKCEKLVPRNRNDAIVLGVGVQTDRHLIVSNDYRDFHSKARKKVLKELDVTILDSDQFTQTA